MNCARVGLGRARHLVDSADRLPGPLRVPSRGPPSAPRCRPARPAPRGRRAAAERASNSSVSARSSTRSTATAKAEPPPSPAVGDAERAGDVPHGFPLLVSRHAHRGVLVPARYRDPASCGAHEPARFASGSHAPAGLDERTSQPRTGASPAPPTSDQALLRPAAASRPRFRLEQRGDRRRPPRYDGGRVLQPPVGYGPAVAVTMSVNLSPVPMAKSGQKVLPVLVRPSYSPTKYPNGPRANGSCSTSNDVSVSRSSLPQSPGSAHVVVAEAWQWTIQWSVGTPGAGVLNRKS